MLVLLTETCFWFRCIEVHDFTVGDPIFNIFLWFFASKIRYSFYCWTCSWLFWFCMMPQSLGGQFKNLQYVMKCSLHSPYWVCSPHNKKVVWLLGLPFIWLYDALYIHNSAVGMSMRKFCWQEILLWCHAQCSRML